MFPEMKRKEEKEQREREMSKHLFRVFLDTVRKEMVKPVRGNDFKWGKLNALGATSVGREIEEKLKVGTKIVSNGENERLVLGDGERLKHRFVAESDRFHYRKEHGKVKELSKKFEALRKDFWVEEAKRKKERKKREAERRLRRKYKLIFRGWRRKNKIQRGKGKTKEKRKVKKLGRIRKQGKSATRKNQRKID